MVDSQVFSIQNAENAATFTADPSWSNICFVQDSCWILDVLFQSFLKVSAMFPNCFDIFFPIFHVINKHEQAWLISYA